ncbi:unnamed protein product [Amoebophrya sp. A25]|nr:unnamed protein product [Amoebophrya sp. A25]|eukprot:GSA25T00009493001.1
MDDAAVPPAPAKGGNDGEQRPLAEGDETATAEDDGAVLMVESQCPICLDDCLIASERPEDQAVFLPCCYVSLHDGCLESLLRSSCGEKKSAIAFFLDPPSLNDPANDPATLVPLSGVLISRSSSGPTDTEDDGGGSSSTAASSSSGDQKEAVETRTGTCPVCRQQFSASMVLRDEKLVQKLLSRKEWSQRQKDTLVTSELGNHLFLGIFIVGFGLREIIVLVLDSCKGVARFTWRKGLDLSYFTIAKSTQGSIWTLKQIKNGGDLVLYAVVRGGAKILHHFLYGVAKCKPLIEAVLINPGLALWRNSTNARAAGYRAACDGAKMTYEGCLAATDAMADTSHWLILDIFWGEFCIRFLYGTVFIPSRDFFADYIFWPGLHLTLTGLERLTRFSYWYVLVPGHRYVLRPFFDYVLKPTGYVVYYSLGCVGEGLRIAHRHTFARVPDSVRWSFALAKKSWLRVRTTMATKCAPLVMSAKQKWQATRQYCTAIIGELYANRIRPQVERAYNSTIVPARAAARAAANSASERSRLILADLRRRMDRARQQASEAWQKF